MSDRTETNNHNQNEGEGVEGVINSAAQAAIVAATGEPEPQSEDSQEQQSEDSQEQQSEDSQEPKSDALLYDADAEQRIPFRLYGKGRHANKVYDIFVTLKALVDGTYIAFDKQRNIRYAGDGLGAIDASNETYAASVWLGKQLLVRVEGWGKEDGSDLSNERLAGVIQEALLASEIESRAEALPADAAQDRPWEEESDEAGVQTHRLRCLYSGRLLVTEHDLKPAGDKQQQKFQRLMAKTKLVEGEQLGRRETKLPSRDEQFGEIYDELLEDVRGYQGRVPLWHKRDVVIAHLSTEQEVFAKK
jgi:hypothetical protein